MTKPLISICIPTYNGEEYLTQCIESCINQTYDNYEIIICDDGSSDNSVSIIELYSSKDLRIKFFKNDKNLGLVGNWNKCIELSSGEWIKFVFQDDYITYNCIDKFAKEITPKTELIVCKRNFILPKDASEDYVNYYTNVVRTLENSNKNISNFFSPQLISDISVKYMAMNFIGEPSLILFKKSIVSKLGNFNHTLKQICDLEFVLRIASQYGLVYIPEQLCSFRIHNNSTTSKNVASQSFILSYIEPLLLSHLLLYSDSYKIFRANLTIFQMIKLKLYFRLKVYKAYRINSINCYNHELFSSINPIYKEIMDYKNGNFVIKFLNNFL